MYLTRLPRALYNLKLCKKEKMHVSAILYILLIVAITPWKKLVYRVTWTTVTCCPLLRRKCETVQQIAAMWIYTRKNEQLDQRCQQLVAMYMLFSTTCYNVVLHPINNCCQQALFKIVGTTLTCSRLTNQQGLNNVVETAQNNVITVLLNAWQINKAWTTLLEQLRSTWFHSSFILSTTANIIVSTMLIRLPVRGLFSGRRKIFSTLIFLSFCLLLWKKKLYINIYRYIQVTKLSTKVKL